MSTYNILLVEDEFLLALRKQKELSEYNYEVSHVASGEEAIEMVHSKENSTDLILMDINLGSGMLGTDAAAAILSKKDIPIVFFSSHSEPEIVQKTERISSYGYVLKNASIVILDASIKMALKLFAAKNELKKIDTLRIDEHQQTENRIMRQRTAIAEMVADPLIFGQHLELALNRVNEYLAKTLAVKYCGIWRLNKTHSELESLALFDARNHLISKGNKLNTADFPAYFNAILAENRIYCEDAFNDPRTCELKENYLEKMGITSLLDAGFFVNGQLRGVVCAEHIGEKRKWHPDEESFISTVAAIVGQIFLQRDQTLETKTLAQHL